MRVSVQNYTVHLVLFSTLFTSSSQIFIHFSHCSACSMNFGSCTMLERILCSFIRVVMNGNIFTAFKLPSFILLRSLSWEMMGVTLLVCSDALLVRSFHLRSTLLIRNRVYIFTISIPSTSICLRYQTTKKIRKSHYLYITSRAKQHLYVYE